MRTLILLAALLAGCNDGTGKDDGHDDETDQTVDSDDTGAPGDTDEPDPGQAYTVTGYVASVPYGADNVGRPPWVILLNPVVGSLVAPDNEHAFVQCLTFECGDLRPLTLVEMLCRLGDQADPFGREVCQLVEVEP